MDREGRVYQGDRRNSRIQVFTENGEFIEEWPDIQDPVNVYIDENDAVWVLSAALNRIMKYNRDGVLQYFWGTWGLNWEGGLARPHQIDVDEDGTLLPRELRRRMGEQVCTEAGSRSEQADWPAADCRDGVSCQPLRASGLQRGVWRLGWGRGLRTVRASQGP